MDVIENLQGKSGQIPFQDFSIIKKITEAGELFNRWGEALRQDPQIGSLLNSLAVKIAASNQSMSNLGLSDLCRYCDEKEGGSCCGAGIENKYTPTLLLINILLGKSLPQKRLKPSNCFFLTNKGCGLVLRQVLCVNYLCLKIQRALPLQALTRLQEITGEEMEAGFILEQAIKILISRQRLMSSKS